MPQATIKLRGDVRDAHSGMTRIEDSVKKLMTGVDGLDGKLGLITDKMPGVSKAFNVLTKGGVLGLAIAGVAELGSRIVDLSAEALKVQAAFNNLQFGLKGAADASMGLVDNMTLAAAQVRALELGAVSNKEEFEALIEVGTKMGLVMGGDAAKGVEDLTVALSRQSGPILDNLGIQLTRQQASEELTKQLGRELTQEEKNSAFRIIALQRATKAAKEKNFEDTYALETQKALVAIENTRLKALGGTVTAQTAVNEVIMAYGDQLATVNVKSHYEDFKQFERVLLEYGHTVEDLGGIEQLHNQILKAQNELYAENARKAREAEAAKEQADYERRLQNAQGVVDNAKFELELSRAYGMEAGAIYSQELAILEAEREKLEIKRQQNAEGEAEYQRNEQLITLLNAREETRIRNERSRRRGGGKSRAERDAEEAKKALEAQRRELERNIEVIEAMGLASEDAQRKLLDFNFANAEDDEREEARHAITMFRIEQEAELRAKGDAARKAAREEWWEMEEEDRKRMEAAAKRTEKLLAKKRKQEAKELKERHQRIDEITAQSMDTTTQLTGVIVSASKKRGEAARQEVGEYAAGQQQIMTIAALKHTALGIAASVTGRAIKATAEFTAAGIAGAQAAAFGVTAAAMGYSADGAGGSGGASSLGEAGYAGGGPGLGGPAERPQSGGTAPVSPLDEQGGAVPQEQGQQTQGGTTVIVQGSVISSGELKEILDDGPTGDGTGFKGGMK